MKKERTAPPRRRAKESPFDTSRRPPHAAGPPSSLPPEENTKNAARGGHQDLVSARAHLYREWELRKAMEEEREATLELIRLLHSSNSQHELIRTIITFLRKWSGCDAVGVRLRQGEDYPYFETRGFSADFVQAETRLCAYNEKGELSRDTQGNPVLECMCGNILRGRYNPSLPFFSEHGSFWTNSTSDLLGGTTEGDRGARTRNRCNSQGYESVALIPMRLGKETLGLLQFNDKRRGRFTWETMTLLERMGDSIAIALGQRRAEENLRQSEARFSSLFENSLDGILLTSPDGGIITANPEACRIFGRTEEELRRVGRSGVMDPSDPRLEICLQERRETGRARGELTGIRKDGTRFPLEISTAVFQDRSGVYRTSMIVRDITERKAAEAALRESEERFRSLVESSHDHIFMLDRGGTYLASNNHVRNLYWEGKELTGLSLRDVYPGEAGEFYRSQVEKAFGSGEIIHFEHSFPVPGGLCHHLDTIYPILKNGKIIAVGGICRDITGEKAAEEDRLAYEKRLRSLASELAVGEERERRRIAAGLHDQVGQTLAVAKIKLEALEGESRLGLGKQLGEIGELLDRTIQCTRSLTFDLSPPVLYELGLEAAVEWLAEKTRKDHGLAVEVDSEPRIGALENDLRGFLFNAVREVVFNAVKHSKARCIYISLENGHSHVTARVKDDGVGFEVPAAALMTGVRGGFGLFSLGERLSSLGGNLQIHSEAGRGTEVVISAPRKRSRGKRKGK